LKKSFSLFKKRLNSFCMEREYQRNTFEQKSSIAIERHARATLRVGKRSEHG